MSLERFCEGCSKPHHSAVWYHRNKVDSLSHEWLCDIQYLLLPPQTMWSWRTFLYWNTDTSPGSASSAQGDSENPSVQSSDKTLTKG